MMDCLRAQQLISDALDRLPGDAEELPAAKAHCRECDDCAAFVRALLAVERAGLPEVPAGLADRVMVRVRAEAGREAAAQAAGPAQPATTAPTTSQQVESPARSWTALVSRARDPRRRRAVVTWAAAAAVIFVAAGIGAVAGVRTILVPQQAAMSESALESAGTSELGASDSEALVTEAPLDEGQPDPGAVQKSETPAPDFISVNATVYRLTGPAPTIDTDTLTPTGSTRTDLGETTVARDYEVLGTDDGATVYIEVDDRILSFQRVTRSYGGRLYILQSAPIESFGTWPALPPGFRTPSSEDGSPVFEAAGTDESGTTVYAAVGTPVEDGIAIGPDAPLSDPVAGSPEWTWWKVAP